MLLPNRHFHCQQDEWDTKEDIGKSMKNALYVLHYTKWYLSGRSDVKKIKPVALAIIKLRLSEGISQSVSRAVRQSKILLNKITFKIP